MYRQYKLIVFIIIFIIGCSEPEKPVIKIGKVFKSNVIEETDTFAIRDYLTYTLSQTKPFNTNIITRRFYKGKVYIDMIQKESVDIDIEPGMNKISETFRVRDLLRKYGVGDFMILFIINDSVIAKKSFIIKRPIIIAQPEEPQISEEKPEESEISQTSKPMRPKPMSPSEMMKEEMQ